MKIELKRITHNVRLSQETNAYAADLWVDGKKVAAVSNDGWGGADMVQPLVSNWSEVEAKLDAYFKSLPAEEFYGHSLQPDLEIWCGEQVDRFATLKSVKRTLNKMLCIIDGEGKERNFPKLNPKAVTPAHRELLAQKYPGHVVLNDMDDDTLWTTINNATK